MDASSSTVDSDGFLASAVLVFGLTFALAAFPFPFFIAEIIRGYGPSQTQSNSLYLGWVQEGLAVLLVYFFYLRGRSADFERRYIQYAVLALAGALLGEILQYSTVLQTTAPSAAPNVSLTGVSFQLQGGVSSIIFAAKQASWLSAVPIAGFALAYFSNSRTPPPEEAEASGTVLPRTLFALGVLLMAASYLAGGLVDVVGSRLPQPGQFGFLRSISVTYFPYDAYASDIFFPLLFFFAFYFAASEPEL